MNEEKAKSKESNTKFQDPEVALKELRERVELGDEEDEQNWFVPTKIPKILQPQGMCKDAKKALLNCLRSTDCYQKYGYTPRECLLNVDLPGRNEECEKFETMLASCKWDTIDRKRRFKGVRGINYNQDEQRPPL
ncbi:hypothetical protein ACHWQZ_G012948 [Mnemiopsis leidyi]